MAHIRRIAVVSAVRSVSEGAAGEIALDDGAGGGVLVCEIPATGAADEV
jgi:hypothetical protein